MGGAARLRRTWPQRLLLGFNAFLVVALLAAAGGLYVFEEKLSAVSTVAIDSPESPSIEVGEPRNILIVGTDSAANLDPEDPVTEGRRGERLADVIMVMRIDPATGGARLVSLPRDTRVELSPSGSYGRINAAIAGVNGPRNLIQTIKRNFGISIDNYVEVDFAGFKDLVTQLGGVPVYFAAPVRDPKTGLFVGETGCIVLDPDQALAYARTRSLQYQDTDGRWRFDQTGDLGRITRQQDFVKRAMRRASDNGIRNPGTAFGIVDAAVGSVQMDETLNVGTILELLDVFRAFNPDELETLQIPTFAAPRGGVAYQDVDWDAMGPMLVPFWGFADGPELRPQDIIVDVAGPSSDAERMDLVSAALDEVGFDAEPLVRRQSSGDLTITYGFSGFDAAVRLASHFVDTPELVYDEDIIGPRLVLTLPSEFGGLRAEPVAIEDLPADLREPPEELRDSEPSAVPPEDAGDGDTGDGDTGDGDGDTDASEGLAPGELPFTSSGTRSAPGVLPTDPARAAACS